MEITTSSVLKTRVLKVHKVHGAKVIKGELFDRGVENLYAAMY